MTLRERTTSAIWAHSLTVPVVLTNLGVLLVLLCGRNAAHPVLPVAYTGAAVAMVSWVVLVWRLVARRTNMGSPGGPRR